MPANNPLFSGRWTWKKFGATVIDDIWPEVLFFTSIAIAVTVVSELTSVNLGVSNQLLTVLGLVLGLVISFRTSSAYERYQDGRKMWVNILVASRNLAKMIWIHVSNDRPLPADAPESAKQTELDVIIEKKTMVNLVQAFSVSVKHLLRDEQGPYYHDLYPLISFLPRFASCPPDELIAGPEDEKLPLWNLRDAQDHLVHATGKRVRKRYSHGNLPAVFVAPLPGLGGSVGPGNGLAASADEAKGLQNEGAEPRKDSAGRTEPPRKPSTRQNSSSNVVPGSGNSSNRNSITILDSAPGTLRGRPRHDREQTLVASPGQHPPESILRSRPAANTGVSSPGSPEPFSPPILFPPPPKRSDTVFDPEADVLPHVYSEVPLRPAREPPKYTMYDYIPLLRFFRWIFMAPGRAIKRVIRKAKSKTDLEHGDETSTLATQQPVRPKRKRKAYAQIVESQIPLEVLVVLHNYLAFLIKRNYVSPAMATGIGNNLGLLQDTVANLERICNTPLPFAYQAHLRMSLWIYLALLPFQLITLMHWVTIPATLFASFLLIGFLEIGQEIENPFNYDLNDLDLDYFCLSLQRDLHEITATIYSEPSTFIYTRWNQPFAPVDRRSAEELTKPSRTFSSSMASLAMAGATGTGQPLYTCPSELVVEGDQQGQSGPEPGLSSIRRTLVCAWRDVDEKTRQC